MVDPVARLMVTFCSFDEHRVFLDTIPPVFFIIAYIGVSLSFMYNTSSSMIMIQICGGITAARMTLGRNVKL